MADVLRIFWRAVTDADFYYVERGPDSGPTSGGGQLYFSVSFGEHLDHAELGRFLGVEPPTAIATSRPSARIAPAVLVDPSVTGEIEFRARYKPGRRDDRYYIARQNRRRRTGVRHPAWLPRFGFPEAPVYITTMDDPAIPDLSLLKIYILLDSEGGYHAWYGNSGALPDGLPEAAAALFRPNADSPPNGIIALPEGTISVDSWRGVALGEQALSRDGAPTGPEIEDALDSVAHRAGSRPTGQGFRESAEERRAIELRAMELAREYLEGEGWKVEDVSTTRSYDLHCRQSAETLHAEVKGTTGDGRAVLLTPNEVEWHRSRHPATALLIVSEIALGRAGGSAVTAEAGTLHVIHPWEPDRHGRLEPVGFRYFIS